MKPIRLEMSAFGPYAGKAVIEFDKLGEKGIFLVTGDTGAGKTTIFDAIAFALYNNTSGSIREVNSLRSDFAEENADTYVDFTFSHKGRIYEIHRSPQYMRAKKSGEGYTNQPAKAVLKREPDTPVEGTKQVNEAVEDILRINYDQFKQISMIAQGEFREVLNADTKKRSEILQKIFSTEGYRKMGFIIDARYKEADSKLQETYRSIGQYFDGVEYAEDSFLLDQVTALKSDNSEVFNLDQRKDILARLISEDDTKITIEESEYNFKQNVAEKKAQKFNLVHETNELFKKYDLIQQKFNDLKSEKEHIEALKELVEKQKKSLYSVYPAEQEYIQSMKKYESYVRAAKENEELLKKTDDNLKKSIDDYEEWKKKEPEAENMKKQAALIEAEEPKYVKREELKSSILKTEEELKTLETGKKHAEQTLKNIGEAMAEAEAEKRRLENAPAELVKEQGILDDIIEEIKDYEEIVKTGKNELAPLSGRLKEARDNYKNLRDIYEDAEKKYLKAERIMEENRAGIFASKLEEGVPCPVCGSVHHPSPAQPSPEAVTEAELNRLKKAKEQSEKDSNEAGVAAASINAEYKADADNFRDMCRKAGMDGDKDLNELFKEAIRLADEGQKKTADQKKICRDISLNVKRLNELKGVLEKGVSDLDKARVNAEKVRGEISEKEAAKAGLTGQLSEMENLTYRDLAEAQKVRKGLAENAKNIFDAADAAERTVNGLREKLSSVLAVAETLKKQVEDYSAECQEKKNAFVEVIVQNSFTDSDEYHRYLVPKETLDAEEAETDLFDQEFTKAKAGLEIAKENIEGKERQDEAEAKEASEKAAADARESHQNLTNLIFRKKSNEAIRDKILECEKKAEKQLEKVTLLHNLANLLNGRVSQKNKTSFETYVQMAGFDGIINAANRRLDPISGGQYELCRHEDGNAKNNIALNLDILDNYTGKKRPVSSLSGGESFMASLSLALGLSDYVTASAGGVQIDTVFIDEGFGTLDGDRLNDAINMLDSLSDSNKLIGVISHRDELKQVIPKKILITKTNKGSNVSLDIGL